MTTIKEADWRAKGAELFGPDEKAWRFRCPSCNEVMSVERAKAEVPEHYHAALRGGEPCPSRPGKLTAGWDVTAECIGRYVPGFGCNWCAYGLFSGPLAIDTGELRDDGTPRAPCAFDFDGRPYTGPPKVRKYGRSPGFGFYGTSAFFGDDGERSRAYRYRLGRRWDTGRPLGVIACNPSVADANEDDPTVRVLVGLAQKLGLPALDLANLHAWVATDPKHLAARIKSHGLGVARGPDNARHIHEVIAGSARVLVAWGGFPVAPELVSAVVATAKAIGKPLECIALTKSGAPGHPLRRAIPRELTPWAPR